MRYKQLLKLIEIHWSIDKNIIFYALLIWLWSSQLETVIIYSKVILGFLLFPILQATYFRAAIAVYPDNGEVKELEALLSPLPTISPSTAGSESPSPKGGTSPKSSVGMMTPPGTPPVGSSRKSGSLALKGRYLLDWDSVWKMLLYVLTCYAHHLDIFIMGYFWGPSRFVGLVHREFLRFCPKHYISMLIHAFFWYQNIYSNRHFKKTIGNKTQIYHVWVYGLI